MRTVKQNLARPHSQQLAGRPPAPSSITSVVSRGGEKRSLDDMVEAVAAGRAGIASRSYSLLNCCSCYL
jgi:hypothetical protein